MRRFPSYLIVATALTMCAVAGQASAGQERRRSAPPSASRGSSGSSGQGSQPSQSDRGRSQVQGQRREAPTPQSQTQQQPRNDSRSYAQRQVAPQSQAVPAPRDRFDNRGYSNGYGTNYNSRSYSSYGYGNYGYDSYAPNYRYSGSRIIIAPREPMLFTRSWFSFRPFSRLAIGLTMGYPIDFPSWYDPYMVGTPGYVRPYMPYGGVSFDVEPRDAELWVDGDYIGRVSDYSSYAPPLTLVAGRHHIELTGRNYQSIAFDITVVAGQVIPYQGTLPYYR